ncbi:MAG: nuclear transport factor 2 family protein, partial [Pseudomonadota bacterium]|nr:nuclear transport factor 2 family protein [Pseudomonadota bacterium]
AIGALLQDYFDGLYDGDVAKFERVFHPVAHLYSTDGQTVTDLPRTDYLEMIAGRQSPAAQGLAATIRFYRSIGPARTPRWRLSIAPSRRVISPIT